MAKEISPLLVLSQKLEGLFQVFCILKVSLQLGARGRRLGRKRLFEGRVAPSRVGSPVEVVADAAVNHGQPLVEDHPISAFEPGERLVRPDENYLGDIAITEPPFRTW